MSQISTPMFFCIMFGPFIIWFTACHIIPFVADVIRLRKRPKLMAKKALREHYLREYKAINELRRILFESYYDYLEHKYDLIEDIDKRMMELQELIRNCK